MLILRGFILMGGGILHKIAYCIFKIHYYFCNSLPLQVTCELPEMMA